jgi:uncharacterized protein YkwD
MFVGISILWVQPAQSSADSGTGSAPVSRVAADVITFTNVVRTHYQRAALRANARLMRAAQLQQSKWHGRRRMAHVLPGAQYPRMVESHRSGGLSLVHRR